VRWVDAVGKRVATGERASRHPEDLRIGRCYLPVAEPQGVVGREENFESMRIVYNHWLDVAVCLYIILLCMSLYVLCVTTLAIPRSKKRSFSN